MAAIYKGHAPYDDHFLPDWVNWAQRETTWAGVLALGVVILMIGLVGWAIRAFAPAPKPARPRAASAPSYPAHAADDHLAVPAANAMPKPNPARRAARRRRRTGADPVRTAVRRNPFTGTRRFPTTMRQTAF
ncbi:MAG: hypothetical protein WDN06_02215 [Asticcacaulis sp.]